MLYFSNGKENGFVNKSEECKCYKTYHVNFTSFQKDLLWHVVLIPPSHDIDGYYDRKSSYLWLLQIL